jgi:predicted phosphodiesterase
MTAEKRAEVRRVYAATGEVRATARRCGVSEHTVRKYSAWADGDTPAPAAPAAGPAPTLPAPAPEAGGPTLPEPTTIPYTRYVVTDAGAWLVLTDCHIPHHDVRTITAAVKEAKARGVVGVLLNGDILDCGGVSAHARDVDADRLEDELAAGEQFVAWIRSQFPQARIIYKEGNHENRLPRYLCSQAPELGSLKALQLPALLHLDNYGVEWVADKRPVMLGRLPVLHGHEFGGGAGGVNPARWLFLRAVSTAMCGHFHRASQHDEPGIDGRLHGVWSVGCSCYLHPRWLPLNKWGHGYAMVDVSQGDHFTVTNRRLLPDGRVV